jgi:hypothetical protein
LFLERELAALDPSSCPQVLVPAPEYLLLIQNFKLFPILSFKPNTSKIASFSSKT